MNDLAKQALLALADKNGGTITAEAVVESARDKQSPLHALFEWNDKTAGQAHRIMQARVLIKTVRFEVTVTELTSPRRVPVFGADPRVPGAYATLANLSEDPDAARESAIIEFARAASALKRARAIAIELGLGAEAIATVAALLRNVETTAREFPKL